MDETPHQPHNKLLYRAAAVALLFVGVGVFYYFVVFLPHQANLKAQQEQAALEQQQAQRVAQQRAE
jgi:preprotein translocase subunit YajC